MIQLLIITVFVLCVLTMFLNKTLEEVEQLPFVDKDDICPEFWDDVQKTTDEFLTGYPYISNESITNL